MIDLNNENDPLLFAITLPEGRLIVQWHEAIAVLQKMNIEGEPGVHHIVECLRKASRTPDVAARSTDEALFAAFARMAKAAETSGNA